jgi:hypothetical protein
MTSAIETIMAKCAKGHDNPPGEIFCGTCGRRINRIDTPPDPTTEDLQALQEKIQALEKDIVRRDEEIRRLNEGLEEVRGERDDLAEKHPEVGTILRQLDDKDRALQGALQELDGLRDRLPEPPPHSGGALPHLLIESHPIPNPALGLTFGDQHKSLDLSTTGFRIRASLERTADGSVGLVIHPGALINVKAPGEKRWRRVEGGARMVAESGMVLFDPKGVVNARLGR